MSEFSSEAEFRIAEYAQSRGVSVGTRLGFGNDGTVCVIGGKTAAKAFYRVATFERELEIYQRLREREMLDAAGFAVPQLIDFDEELGVIEMDLMAPPYILDFGKAYLDRKPDYSAETLADWQEERIELFGEQAWKRVRRALAALAGIGIHYYDAKPGNVELGS